MPESATQPQSDTPSDTQPVIGEPLLPPQEPPSPARWRVSKGALLLIGVPLAGALVTWLGISIFSSSSNPAAPPAAVIEQPAPQPAIETQPALETNVESSAEAEPEPEPVDPAPVDPEPLPPPYAPPS